VKARTPDILAAEIVEDLQSALEELTAVQEELTNRDV